jgi:hypothetical protein
MINEIQFLALKSAKKECRNGIFLNLFLVGLRQS